MGAREVEDTGRTLPSKPVKQGSWGLTKTEEAIKDPAWVCAGSSAYRLCPMAWCFGETSDRGSGGSLTHLSAFGILFFLLGYLGQPCCEGLCLVLLYPVVVCLVDAPRGLVLF